jgi:hypothetical protein
VERDKKFVPVTVNVNPLTPAVTALGLSAVIEGMGFESRDSYECFVDFGMARFPAPPPWSAGSSSDVI